MTQRHKSFGNPVVDDDIEAPSFDIYGEDFYGKKHLQGAALLKFVHDADSGDGGRAAGAMLDFFKKVLEPDSFVRFQDLWDDPDRVVPMETLGEIVAHLVQEYTNRPTRQSRES
jgi:hypothetical protein